MGSLGSRSRARNLQQAPEGARRRRKAESYMDMLNSMFDSGLEVQKSYQKSMEAIFETYMPKTPSSTPQGIKKPGDGWEAGHRASGRAIGYHPAGKTGAGLNPVRDRKSELRPAIARGARQMLRRILRRRSTPGTPSEIGPR